MAVQNNNVQQQAVAASLASADQVSDNMRDTVMREAQSSSKTKPSESLTKQLLEDGGTKANASILSGLLAKLGDNFTPKKVANKLAKDYEFLFDGQEEQVEDKVDIKSFQRIRKARGRKNVLSQDGQNDSEAEAQKETDVKSYLKAYTSYLVGGSSELKKKVDKMEQQLLKDGKLKLEVLKQFRSKAGNSVRGEVLKQLKKAFHKELFSGDKLEAALARHELTKTMDWARLNDRIGGDNFGGQYGSKTQVAKEAAAGAKADAQDFLQEELGRSLASKHLADKSQQKGVEEEINSLLKVAQKAGFDLEGFFKKIPDMLDAQGMLPVISYESAPGSMGEQGQGERQQYQYNADEEKDIMLEQMRVLYMQRAIFGDWKTSIGISVRMIKTRNGLIKLGLRMEDFSELAVEGKKLAKLKLVQMLREAFEERATYAQARGPAWLMTEKKIKTILKNLVKLSVEFDDKDIEIMRDSANEKMFTEAEHELRLIDTALEARDTAYLRQKRKLVLQIMERVAAESNIPFNIDGVKKLSIAT